MSFLLVLFLFAPLKATIVNPSEVKWTHEKGGAPEAERAVFRGDDSTGALELLVRFEGGHVFKPHWHASNEHLILFEGQMTVNGKTLEAGGIAFLPAKEVQTLVCSSKTRCSFYLAWDGNPKSNPPPVQ